MVGRGSWGLILGVLVAAIAPLVIEAGGKTGGATPSALASETPSALASETPSMGLGREHGSEDGSSAPAPGEEGAFEPTPSPEQVQVLPDESGAPTRRDVPPLLLDPRPEAHAKGGKPEWEVDPAHSIRWVIVVRHAEKAAEPKSDPPLTDQGRERAKLLERMLVEAGPTLLLGTELIRTQRTLEPLAAELGLLVDVHESDDPYGMAARVVELDRPVSVVAAHGDTIVPILEALTGLDLENLHPIEYDDFFIVAIAPGVTDGAGRAAASVLRLQYGPGD